MSVHASRAAPDRQRGSVSIVAAGVVFVACIACLLSIDLSRALLARARAQTAADAAALAAAQEIAIPRGIQPVDIARRYAESNGATLGSCACDGGGSNAVVEVRVSFPLVLLGPYRTVVASARAVIGPPERIGRTARSTVLPTATIRPRRGSADRLRRPRGLE